MPIEEDEDINNNLETLYKESGLITRVYLEWRHKVLVRFFLAMAGFLVMARWMFDNEALHEYLFIPFLLAGLMSIVTALMDNVNGRILGDCYKIGESLESSMSKIDGIYRHTNKQYSHPITYTNILRILYWGSGCIFLAISLIVNIVS